ncbi:MAG: formylglycine-generating enzyme family protein [Treponema sp.]|nr:formylglycine-generating enzyme family protein [Treponema sp.]
MKKLRMAFFALATLTLLATSAGCGGGTGSDSDDDDTPVAESGSTGGSGTESGSSGSGSGSTGGSGTGSTSTGTGGESTGGSGSGSGSSESGSGNTSTGSSSGSGTSESGSGNSSSGTGNESTGGSGTGSGPSESGSGNTSTGSDSGSGSSENESAGNGSGTDGFVLVQRTTSNGRTNTTDLWVCDHEVTQGEYELHCGYGSNSPSDTYGKGSNYPVYFVSLYDALVYCNKRSIAEGLTPCYTIDGRTDLWTSDSKKWDEVSCNFSANGYRLPTKEEWRYLARGGNTSNSGSNDIEAVAWYNGNSGGKTHEVRTKDANALGLYDMIGNVCEWCWDYHMVQFTVSYNMGLSWKKEYYRYQYYCGGSWCSSASDCAVSSDSSTFPGSRDSGLGFRVVRSSSN